LLFRYSIEIPSIRSILILIGTLNLFAMILIVSNIIDIPSAEGAYKFDRKWGELGTGSAQFNWTSGVALDSSGNVYVGDYWNDRIQKFTSSGTFITAWGTPGRAEGQFFGPLGVALDRSGNVYVADSANNRIQMFKLASPCPSGTIQIVSGVCFIRAWGEGGSENGQFRRPVGVAVDPSGNVYVSDLGNDRVQKFGSTGGFFRAWGEHGSGDGQFNTPQGLTVSSGNVYVADQNNARIQKFTNTGTFTTKWGGFGSLDGQFRFPFDVAVHSSGIVVLSERVFVSDTDNNRIQVFFWKPDVHP